MFWGYTLTFYHNTQSHIASFVDYDVTAMCYIVGQFGGGEVWRIDSFQVLGRRKFGK